MIRATSSRLQAPTLRANVLRRPRLLTRVAGAYDDTRWISVIAPAGYGKTTLMATIAESRREFDRIGWLTVAQGDTMNDLAAGILSSIRATFPLVGKVQEATQASIDRQGAPHRLAVLLADEIEEFAEEPMLLVIDDLHRLADPSAVLMLGDLIELLPSQVRILTGSRVKLDLPYARWQSRGGLVAFDFRDLQLTEDETGRFVRESLDLEVSDEQVRSIHERTGGWTAGLNLLHSAGGIGKVVANNLPTWIEYLETEVLGQMSREDQRLLVRCAMLESLDPVSCSRVLDEEVLAEQLRRIHEQNRFVEALDLAQGVYRVHDIFRDFLQGRLQLLPLMEIASLYARAAEANDNPLAASRMLANAGLYDLVLARLRKDLVAIQAEANTASLLNILESVPNDQCADPGILHYLLGFCYAERWQFKEARRELDLAFHFMERTGDPALGYAKTLLVHISWAFSDLTKVWDLTEDALQSDVSETAKITLLCARAWQQNLRGDSKGAVEDAQAALDLATSSEDPAALYELLGVFQGPIFRIAGLAVHAAKALPFLKSAIRGRETPQRALVHQFECYLAICNGDWNTAIDLGEKALAISDRFGGLQNTIVEVGKQLPFCYILMGNPEGAEQCLERVREVIMTTNAASYPRPWLDTFMHHSIRLALSRGQIVKAKSLLEEATSTMDSRWPTAKWFHTIARALIAMAEGRQERAMTGFATAAKMQERWPNLVAIGDANLYLAYLHLQKGEVDEARELFEPIVRREFGYQRPGFMFMAGRDIVEPLLAISEMEEMRVLRTILATMPEGNRKVTIPGSEEHLTPREVEVLELVASGASNTEIAERLVISPFTVKRHVTHLLTKLGVNSRTKAAKVASELLHR